MFFWNILERKRERGRCKYLVVDKIDFQDPIDNGHIFIHKQVENLKFLFKIYPNSHAYIFRASFFPFLL